MEKAAESSDNKAKNTKYTRIRSQLVNRKNTPQIIFEPENAFGIRPHIRSCKSTALLKLELTYGSEDTELHMTLRKNKKPEDLKIEEEKEQPTKTKIIEPPTMQNNKNNNDDNRRRSSRSQGTPLRPQLKVERSKLPRTEPTQKIEVNPPLPKQERTTSSKTNNDTNNQVKKKKKRRAKFTLIRRRGQIKKPKVIKSLAPTPSSQKQQISIKKTDTSRLRPKKLTRSGSDSSTSSMRQKLAIDIQDFRKKLENLKDKATALESLTKKAKTKPKNTLREPSEQQSSNPIKRVKKDPQESKNNRSNLKKEVMTQYDPITSFTLIPNENDPFLINMHENQSKPQVVPPNKAKRMQINLETVLSDLCVVVNQGHLISEDNAQIIELEDILTDFEQNRLSAKELLGTKLGKLFKTAHNILTERDQQFIGSVNNKFKNLEHS